MKISKKEHLDAMKSNSLALAECNGTVRPYITAAWGHQFHLQQIDTYTRAVLHELLKRSQSRVSQTRYIESLQKTDLPFLCHLKTCLNQILHEQPWHQLNPYITLFSQMINDDVILWDDSFYDTAYPLYIERDDDKFTKADRWKRAIETLYQRGTTKAFKKKVENFIRPGNKKHKEFEQYVNDLSLQHPSLFTVRADMGYEKPRGWPSDLSNSIRFEEVQKHLSAFTRRIKSKFASNYLVGYAFKIEHSLHQGFQIQALFIFNGDNAKNDTALADRLNTIWKSDATAGIGLFFDWSDSKVTIKSCGSGLIRWDDQDARDALRKAVAYMTKTEHYMTIRPPKGIRVFRKGRISRGSVVPIAKRAPPIHLSPNAPLATYT